MNSKDNPENPEISNILLDEKTLKFKYLRTIYADEDNITIDSKTSLTEKEESTIRDLNNFLSKELNIKCVVCKKEILSFNFYIKEESKHKSIILCNECYNNEKKT